MYVNYNSNTTFKDELISNLNSNFISNYLNYKFCHDILLEVFKKATKVILKKKFDKKLDKKINLSIKEDLNIVMNLHFNISEKFNSSKIVKDDQLDVIEIDNWGCNKIKWTNKISKEPLTIDNNINITKKKFFIKKFNFKNKEIKKLDFQKLDIDKNEEILRYEKDQEYLKYNLNKKLSKDKQESVEVKINLPVGQYTYDYNGFKVEFRKKAKIKKENFNYKTEVLDKTENITKEKTKEVNFNPQINFKPSILDNYKNNKYVLIKKNNMNEIIEPNKGVKININQKIITKEIDEHISNQNKISISDYKALKRKIKEENQLNLILKRESSKMNQNMLKSQTIRTETNTWKKYELKKNIQIKNSMPLKINIKSIEGIKNLLYEDIENFKQKKKNIIKSINSREIDLKNLKKKKILEHLKMLN